MGEEGDYQGLEGQIEMLCLVTEMQVQREGSGLVRSLRLLDKWHLLALYSLLKLLFFFETGVAL